jgi:hypothetical protein
MSQPLDQNPQQLPQVFRPEAEFAIAAQQEEITELRDRNIYLKAVLKQAQSEAVTQAEAYTAEIGRLQGEISLLRSELAREQDQPTPDTE